MQVSRRVNTADTQKVIQSVISRLRILNEKLLLNQLTFHFGGRVARASRLDLARILMNFKVNSLEEQGIKNIIIDSILSAEYLSAGAGYLLFQSLIENKELYFHNRFTRIEKKQVIQLVRQMTLEGLSRKILNTILDHGSIDTEVILDTSNICSYPTIHIDTSFSIGAFMHNQFPCRLKRIENAGLIVVNGVIEKISQLELIMQSSSHNKKSIILIAKNFSPDVITTLYENYKNSKLFIFPFVLEVDDSFEDLSNIATYFDYQNHYALNSLSTDSIDFIYSGNIHNGGLSLSNFSSQKRRTTIVLPDYYKNSLGLIEDRIKFGVRHFHEIMQSGAGIRKGTNEIYSNRSIHVYKKSYKKIQKLLENLDSLILQE